LSTSDTRPGDLRRRVYPLDARKLSEEQIAVAFAMTSRRPEPFDEIARQVSQEKAADFHQRWVLGYGHASVAEHAVVHLAVENVSRLACDTLEDNRLASYTEKSSRYQVLPEGSYHFPAELDDQPALGEEYRRLCDHLFRSYHQLIDGALVHLRQIHPQRENERESTYNLRLRRLATDSCRAILPAAALTNVGLTANARMLEHIVSKLMSSELAEERDLGVDLRGQGREITPTLIRYAEENPCLRNTARRQQELSAEMLSPDRGLPGSGSIGRISARLLDWDTQAEEKLATALLYPKSGTGYETVRRQVEAMDSARRRSIIDDCTAQLGPHDAPGREFELVNYTFEFLMDYGAYREFKRHRMLTYVPQALTAANGHGTPELIARAGLTDIYRAALESVDQGFQSTAEFSPLVAQYLVTHAHFRRVLVQLNLRECYHLFKLRTSELAHFAIREPVLEAMKLVMAVHPQLFRHLRLRDYPEWWPFPH
jgi:thymidylate synthase ThyX